MDPDQYLDLSLSVVNILTSSFLAGFFYELIRTNYDDFD